MQEWVARAEPAKRWELEESFEGREIGLLLLNFAEVFRCRQDAARADQAVDLRPERNERDQVNRPESGKKDPAREDVGMSRVNRIAEQPVKESHQRVLVPSFRRGSGLIAHGITQPT